jgi:outer membrane protein
LCHYFFAISPWLITSKLYSAKQKLSDARYNYILSTLQLKQTAGTLSEQDLLDINQGLMAKK